MPTYNYQCFACEHTFETVQKISEPSLDTCPKCAAVALKRIISASAFHLKGSGWYKTDYANGSANKAKPSISSEESTSSSSSSDSKESESKETKKSESSESASNSAPSEKASSE